MDYPEDFGAFLVWMKDVVLTWWRERQLRLYPDAPFGSLPWQQHAGWTDGLTPAALSELEQHWRISFPPDYRLFLELVHTADRPADFSWKFPTRETWEQSPFFWRVGCYNWQLDTARMQEVLHWAVDGLLRDAQENNLWKPSWGVRPTSSEERAVRVMELVAAAPKLIPIEGQSYLVAEPCVAGNPVLHIVQSDIVVFGEDLRAFMVNNFRPALRPGRMSEVSPEAFARIRQIPFWGELVGG